MDTSLYKLTTHSPSNLLFEQLGLITESHGVGLALPEHLRKVTDLSQSSHEFDPQLLVTRDGRGQLCSIGETEETFETDLRVFSRELSEMGCHMIFT